MADDMPRTEAAAMYDLVRPARKKRDWRLWAVIGLFVLVLGVGVLGAVWSVGYQLDYKDFLNCLSRDGIYARKFESLTFETGGETCALDREKGYKTFVAALSIAGPGRTGSPPDRDPDAVVDYGNGSTLSLWRVELKGYTGGWAGGNPQEGVFVQYEGRRGERYAYETSGLDMGRTLNWLIPKDTE